MAAVLAALAVPAAVVWACVGLISFNITPSTVQPGSTVTVTGLDFAPNHPVLIHLDSVNGPVIGTIPPSAIQGTGVMTSHFNTPMTLPSNLGGGQHVLIATQDEYNMNGGNPARAVIYVGMAPPARSVVSRPVAPAIDSGVNGVGALALMAVGAAVFSFVVFGALALRALRRPAPGAGAGTA